MCASGSSVSALGRFGLRDGLAGEEVGFFHQAECRKLLLDERPRPAGLDLAIFERELVGELQEPIFHGEVRLGVVGCGLGDALLE